MDIMEKVEMLREKANISYEEAKKILDEANGDLLDAMVILERQGKVRKPETEVEVFNPEPSKDEAEAEEKTASEEKASSRKTDTAGKKVSRTVNKILNVLKNNTLSISRKNENLFTMPAWAFALILLFTWKWMIWVIVISLFFQVRYSFEGKDDLSAANDFMDKVSSMAEDVASEFKK